MSILALDPGGTTGWFWWDRGAIRIGQINKDPHHMELYGILTQFLGHNKAQAETAEPLVICERFEFRKSDQHRDKINYISAEYVGIVKLFAQQYNMPLVMQSAAQAKGFFGDDAVMKLAGLWKPNQKHAMDAARHFAYYRTFTKHDPTYLNMMKK